MSGEVTPGGGKEAQVHAAADFVFSFTFGDLVLADDFELGPISAWDLLRVPCYLLAPPQLRSGMLLDWRTSRRPN